MATSTLPADTQTGTADAMASPAPSSSTSSSRGSYITVAIAAAVDTSTVNYRQRSPLFLITCVGYHRTTIVLVSSTGLGVFTTTIVALNTANTTDTAIATSIDVVHRVDGMLQLNMGLTVTVPAVLLVNRVVL